MIRVLETVEIPAGSVEFVEAVVYARDPLAGTDPEIALVSGSGPVTWLPASWVGTPGTDGTARTDAVQTLAGGTYTVRVRLASTPEAPIRDAYTLSVY